MPQKRFLDIFSAIEVHHKERRRQKAQEPYFAEDGHVKTLFHSYMDGTTLVLGSGCATIVEENGKRILDIYGQVDGSTIIIS